jgi:tRNA 5-methylaminomethyl-2-thiouridine biosynthesis bifunctional protein
LAGAATAHALAVRGCEVTVLEARPVSSMLSTTNAAPSAGLPVALMAPHHAVAGKAPSAVSQLGRLGLAATTYAAQALLVQGQDWQPCGALQRAGKLSQAAHWFGDAAWVKPAALVSAWLAHPRISLRTGAAVHSLHAIPGSAPLWQAIDAQGTVLAEATACVLANAYQAKALIARLLPANGMPAAHAFAAEGPLHPVAGQVVYGPWTAEWQALWPVLLPELAQHRPSPATASGSQADQFCAVNGNGHFIPAVPWGEHGARIWLSGSTYEHGTPEHPEVTPQGIAANLQRLQQLIPAAAPLLAAQHSAGLLQAWAGTRCTTQGRLPWAGPVSPSDAPGLYACTAMGSRGLSFAAICGQHVAGLVLQTGDSQLPAHLQRAVSPSGS